MTLPRYKSNLYFSHEFPLAISTQRNQQDIELHAHDFMELVVISGGSGEHYTATEQYPVSVGDVFVIQPGLSHGYRKTRSLRLLNILFDLSWFDRLTSEIPKKPGFYLLFQRDPRQSNRRIASRLHLNAKQFKALKPLLEQLKANLSRGHDNNNIFATGLLLEITGFLSACYKSNEPKPAPLLQVDAIMGYIEAHYAEEISLPQLADIAKISSRNLLRLFRNATGTTPIDYLLRYRISRACRLLVETDWSVTKIAFDVGFSDGNYFCRQFKRIIRISPARYRAMQAMLK